GCDFRRAPRQALSSRGPATLGTARRLRRLVAMDLKFLEFEQPIAELEARIDALKFVGEDSELNISEEISRLRNKSESLTRSIFSNLTAWQIAQLARHPQRPYTLDYIDKCFTDFQELYGDRMYADDHSLVGGLARL